MELSPLLAVMVETAKQAGQGLMRDFASVDALDIRQKNGPSDFFSEADLRSEKLVRETLSRAYPTYGFLGEEGGLVEGSDKSRLWVVDPLDGTTNFLLGIPAWAVCIALVQDGKAVAGVTYAPVTEEMFCAEAGRGAFLNGKPMHVSKRVGLDQAVLSVGIPFKGKLRHERFHAEMQRLTRHVAGIRRLGAGALDMAYVACGRFDAYWEQQVSPWDLAAGAILVEEAGGVVSDTAGKPLDIMNGTVLATTAQLRPLLLPELAPPG
jgi:myo-inositol-1(or 4)-monophosphatase